MLTQAHFHNEAAAYAFLEARIWPKGPVCPHCGSMERIGKLAGATTRMGSYKCYVCRKPFTVKLGTLFESSHIPLRLWLQAIYLLAGNSEVSAAQLGRTLGITHKSAWQMVQRIRATLAHDAAEEG